jgi:hypothetical protein
MGFGFDASRRPGMTADWHRTCMILTGSHAGDRIMFTDIAGFLVGLALTLTLLVAIADMDIS